MNALITPMVMSISVLLFLWVAFVIYNRLKPTEFAAYLANIAQVALIVVTVGSSVFIYTQTDRNFRQTTENSDRQFQLANRPYLQVIPKSLSVVGGIDRGGTLPEVEFNFSTVVINHGQLPASVQNIEVLIQNIEDSKKVCLFMPYPWDTPQKSTDIFPYKEVLFNDFFGKIYLNINDVAKIMTLGSDFLVQNSDKVSPFWKGNKADIARVVQGELRDFFLIIQIEYKTAGDIANEKIYYHSSKFKIQPHLADRLSSIEESINGDTPEQGKWFNVGEHGVERYTISKKETLNRQSDPSVVKSFHGFSDDSKNILLNILGGLLTVLITDIFIRIRRWMRQRELRAVFGNDIVNAVKAYIVYANFRLRPGVQNGVRWPYEKPDGNGSNFSIENPVSGCEARAANYPISVLSREGGRFPSFSPDTQVRGFVDISFISLGGPDSNYKTDDANRNPGNALVVFDQPNGRMVRVGTSIPLFQREPGFDYGLILKIHPQQHPERVWIVCAGFDEWGSSGAAYYLSQNWKKIYRRSGSASFAIIVKVRPTQDDSAEPIYQS